MKKALVLLTLFIISCKSTKIIESTDYVNTNHKKIEYSKNIKTYQGELNNDIYEKIKLEIELDTLTDLDERDSLLELLKTVKEQLEGDYYEDDR